MGFGAKQRTADEWRREFGAWRLIIRRKSVSGQPADSLTELEERLLATAPAGEASDDTGRMRRWLRTAVDMWKSADNIIGGTDTVAMDVAEPELPYRWIGAFSTNYYEQLSLII